MANNTIKRFSRLQLSEYGDVEAPTTYLEWRKEIFYSYWASVDVIWRRRTLSLFSPEHHHCNLYNKLKLKIDIKCPVRLKHTTNRLWVSSLTTSPELCIYQNIDLLTFTRKRIFEDHIRLILKLLRADHLITAINLSLKNCCCVLCIGRSNLGIQNSLERAIYLTRRRRKAL